MTTKTISGWNRASSILVLLLCVPVVLLQAQTRIVDTRHNLSVTGPGTIKAAAERQPCVFCHTPHSSQQLQPLWNHRTTVATYTLYSSDYLMELNYPLAAQPNVRSKLCLSCHDGTVAVGAVYNLPGGGGMGTIPMSGGITTIPADRKSNLGVDLRNDHPVGFRYDPASDPHLVARPWPWNTPVKLDPDAPHGTVECQTCHDPHNNQHGSFLRISNTNAALCTFCHTKPGWSNSIHNTSAQLYTPPRGTITSVGEWSCRNCHTAHGGAGSPYLLNRVEEQTCFTAGCHGQTSPAPTTKNIQTTLAKTYRHPTADVNGKHRNPDNATSLNVPNRHAECADCHNAHEATKGLHTTGTNQVSNVLRGVRGVVPGPAVAWTQPTTFTQLESAVQENQICFTCHSYYGFGVAPDGVSTIVGPSGEYLTDQAMEFNPENRSAHPVRVGSLSQTGARVPRGLSSAQMTPQWNAVGTQTMYCSDCHGNDEATSATVPRGPHGANSRFMLTGGAKYWPTNAFGELWSLDDIRRNRNNWQSDLFCVNCHTLSSSPTWTNNAHAQDQHHAPEVKCVTCHVAVPHGAKRSRLIGYASDVAPYNYSGIGTYERLVITGFQKAATRNDYARSSCSTPGLCHGIQFGTYEP